MPPRNPYTAEEITLCIYAARYDAEDFGGIDAIEALRSRSTSSIIMKIQNIAAMCDEEGINRNPTLSSLTGRTSGETGRRTNWSELQASLALSKEELLNQCIEIAESAYSYPDELISATTYTEGAKRTVVVNAYERDLAARKKCIEHHGNSCAICAFNFGESYGPVAEGFIHVHHIKALSEIGHQYVVDPIEDLIPVCPNCHAVIHLGRKNRAVSFVKSLLKSKH